MSRFFYDTEFIEDGRTIELVSVAVVAEDGAEYYAVSTEFDPAPAVRWVRENVLAQLPSPADPAWKPRRTIRDELLAFVTARPAPVELWAWYGAYDHVALCQLFGRMTDLPRSLPRFTRDLRQLWEEVGSPVLPPAPPDAHDALADARHNLRRWQLLAPLREQAVSLRCPTCASEY